MTAEPSPTNAGIVFFDGYCNLCNSSVDFLMRHDRRKRLLFASLQGKKAEELGLATSGEAETMVYFRNNKAYHRSGAVLRMLGDMGALWKVMLVFLLVPGFIRDGIYRLVAKNRYRWFGRKNTCRIPTEAERLRFLE